MRLHSLVALASLPVLFGIAVASNAQPSLVPVEVTPIEVSIHPSSSAPVTRTNSATFGNLSVVIGENFVELTGGAPLDFELMTAVFEYVVPGPPGSTPLVVARRQQSFFDVNGDPPYQWPNPGVLKWESASGAFYDEDRSWGCVLAMVTSTLLEQSAPALFDINVPFGWTIIDPLDVLFFPGVAGDTIRWEVTVKGCRLLSYASTFSIRLDIRTPSPGPPAPEITAEEFDALATNVESIDTRLDAVESLRGIRDRMR